MSMVKPLSVASIASLTLMMTSITSAVQSPQQMLGPVGEHHKHGLHEGPEEAHQKDRRRRSRVKYGPGDIRKRRSSRCPFALTTRGQEKPFGRWFRQMLIPRLC